MKRTLLIAVILVCTLSAGGQSILYDAANQYLDNTPFEGFRALRLQYDNSGSSNDVEGVRLKLDVHNGYIMGLSGCIVDDVDNPWCGNITSQQVTYKDDKEYSFANVYYPGTQEASVGYKIKFLPSHPEYTPLPETWDPNDIDTWDELANTEQVLDIIPAGIICDTAYKFLGTEDFEIFSVSQSTLTHDFQTTILTDSDPTPQTVPEPGTLLVTLAGVGLLSRKK